MPLPVEPPSPMLITIDVGEPVSSEVNSRWPRAKVGVEACCCTEVGVLRIDVARVDCTGKRPGSLLNRIAQPSVIKSEVVGAVLGPNRWEDLVVATADPMRVSGGVGSRSGKSLVKSSEDPTYIRKSC